MSLELVCYFVEGVHMSGAKRAAIDKYTLRYDFNRGWLFEYIVSSDIFMSG